MVVSKTNVIYVQIDTENRPELIIVKIVKDAYLEWIIIVFGLIIVLG